MSSGWKIVKLPLQLVTIFNDANLFPLLHGNNMATESESIDRPSRDAPPAIATPSTDSTSTPTTATTRDSNAKPSNRNDRRQNGRPSSANKADRGRGGKRKREFGRKEKW